MHAQNLCYTVFQVRIIYTNVIAKAEVAIYALELVGAAGVMVACKSHKTDASISIL